ncbi:MAG: integrase [Hyphomicrobiales bacterium]|nr:MAG: integrase [Hyphomicrobiales bacterium]
MEPMPRERLQFVQREKTRHGKMVWYFRIENGPRRRLPDEYGSEEFLEAYFAALKGEPKPAPKQHVSNKSLSWLIDRYTKSLEFEALAETTQYMRKNILEGVKKTGGNLKYTDITKAKIVEGRDKRAKTPFAAKNFVKVMSQMFTWAVGAELIKANPTIGISLPTPKTTGHHVWTDDEVLKYQKKHPLGTKARLAMDLLLYTGFRRSDIVKIGRQHVKNGVLSFRTQKSGKTVLVTLPILKPLQKSIEAGPCGDLTFLVTEHGKPHSVKGFGNWFGNHCKAAEVPGRAHGLRKAGATAAAENGATSHQLMSIFGWLNPRQADQYTQEADRKRLSMDAAHLMISQHRKDN